MSKVTVSLEKAIRNSLGKNNPATVQVAGYDQNKRTSNEIEHWFVFDNTYRLVLATSDIEGLAVRHLETFYAWIDDNDDFKISRSNPFATKEEKEIDPKSLYPILEYFEYKHLPPHLQKVSKCFHDIAHGMVEDLASPRGGPEISAGLRKLLEAKDCMVRAAVTGAIK